MKWKPYPAYKDSGVEWLGEVPNDWSIAQYKRMVEIQNGSDHKHIEVDSDEGFPVYGSGGIFSYASDYLYDGESILLGRKGTIDKPLYVNTKFWTVDTMYWTKVLKEASGRFAYYTALSIPFDYYSTSTALPSMTKSDLSAHVVCIPKVDDQRIIATFLDRETAKLDTLISNQERLIELLQEKRQAIISHAVTKGLDPDVPMKDSGIEWLGEVPEHWVVRKLKYGLRLLSDKSGERENTVGLENIEGWSGKFIETDSEFEGDGIKFNKGDILFGKLRPYLAKVYLAEFSGEAVGDFHVMRPQSDVIGRFAQYQMLNRDFISIVDGSTFGAKMPRASWEFVGSMLVTIPPLAEQEKIAKYLDEQTKTIELLINKARQSIDLAKEHRTALISAAVTGKIDVREAA